MSYTGVRSKEGGVSEDVRIVTLVSCQNLLQCCCIFEREDNIPLGLKKEKRKHQLPEMRLGMREESAGMCE